MQTREELDRKKKPQKPIVPVQEGRLGLESTAEHNKEGAFIIPKGSRKEKEFLAERKRESSLDPASNSFLGQIFKNKRFTGDTTPEIPPSKHITSQQNPQPLQQISHTEQLQNKQYKKEITSQIARNNALLQIFHEIQKPGAQGYNLVTVMELYFGKQALSYSEKNQVFDKASTNQFIPYLNEVFQDGFRKHKEFIGKFTQYVNENNQALEEANRKNDYSKLLFTDGDNGVLESAHKYITKKGTDFQAEVQRELKELTEWHAKVINTANPLQQTSTQIF